MAARLIHRALTLLVTTAMNHLAPGGRVTVRLTSGEAEALLNVDLTGAPIPAGELLRVVGHFRDRHDEELPLDASSRTAGTTARNSLITAAATSTDTTSRSGGPAEPRAHELHLFGTRRAIDTTAPNRAVAASSKGTKTMDWLEPLVRGCIASRQPG